MKHTAFSSALVALAAALPAACSDDKSDADYKSEVVVAMHDSIGDDLADLVQAARDLQAAAPSHAWNTTTDAAAITAMRDAWRRTRVAYEHVEGATAPLFGSLDITLDARYDDYLAKLGENGDHALFDATGVTGMHGIERILYAPDIRAEVVTFERTLPGYEPAKFPATDDDALSFKNVLVGKLIEDTVSLHDQWKPAAIDIGAAFQGLVGLMNEQKEKVNLAATGEEESRYANLTLFDLRNNLEGTRQVYEMFRPWIQNHANGKASDDAIQAKFTALATLYDANPGDALPPVPETWSSDKPSDADLATPFGTLWQTVHENVDPAKDGSIVFEMNQIATLLGFKQFIEDQ